MVEVQVGDVVELRKPHPCGANEWTVVRIGADIGLRCNRCSHRILLARGVFEGRLRRFLSKESRNELPHDLDQPSGR